MASNVLISPKSLQTVIKTLLVPRTPNFLGAKSHSFVMQKCTVWWIVENPNSVFSKNIYKLLLVVNYMHPLKSFKWLLSKVQQIVIYENMKKWIKQKQNINFTWGCVTLPKNLTAHNVFPHIVSAETILFWLWPYVLWPLITVHTGAETIQGRKLFKGGNYSQK